jgi:hypothetical protein
MPTTVEGLLLDGLDLLFDLIWDLLKMKIQIFRFCAIFPSPYFLNQFLSSLPRVDLSRAASPLLSERSQGLLGKIETISFYVFLGPAPSPRRD